MNNDELNKSNEVPLIQVENLRVSFTQYSRGTQRREIEVIHDISLDVKKGEILAVIGASGSGKSLLAHAIMGILPKNASTDGIIKYNGREIDQSQKEKLRGREISLIPQSVSYLDPMMAVKNQIESPLKKQNGKEKKAILDRLLERFQLKKEVADKYPFELSGGMARRVLISTALTSGASLIIADEPTPGMHQSVVQETLDAFKSMAQSGCGVLMITHDIDLAFTIAHRVAVFCDGKVVSIEETDNFVNHPEKLKSAYSRALWHALPQNGFYVEKGKTYDGEITDSEATAKKIGLAREAV